MEYEIREDRYGKYWYLNGKLHREDGPAVEGNNGDKEWWLNGRLHREDGPAVEGSNGYKSWYLNGELHREDGPAVEFVNGDKYWYLNGSVCSQKLYLEKLKCKHCGGKYRSIKAINDYIYYCPRCQR